MTEGREKKNQWESAASRAVHWDRSVLMPWFYWLVLSLIINNKYANIKLTQNPFGMYSWHTTFSLPALGKWAKS